jgi:hypothetical protein
VGRKIKTNKMALMAALHFSTLVAVHAILIRRFNKGVAFLIDDLFWYTGLIVWVLISLACASMIAVQAHDRSVMSRGPNIA